VESGRVFVDGKGVGDIGSCELRDRRHLANHGMVVVLLALNQIDRRDTLRPGTLTRGFVPEEEAADYLEQARAAVREHPRRTQPRGGHRLGGNARRGAQGPARFFNRTLERRPLILPFIMEL
jgi:ribonuclease J